MSQYDALPRPERIKQASEAYHAGREHEDTEANGWLEELLIDVEMIQLFNGSLLQYESLNRPFVEDVRALVVGKRQAEKAAQQKEESGRLYPSDGGTALL